MYQQSGWDLSDIRSKDIDLELQAMAKLASALEKKKAHLDDDISASVFLSFVQELEQLKIRSSKLSVYASLRFAENSTDQSAVAEMSKVETALTKISNQLLFFGLWFKDLPEKKAKELIEASGDNKYHFEELRKTKPYILKEREEQIINIKDTTGVSALTNVYNILTSQFTFRYQGKELNQEELITLARDPSPQVRKGAYHVLLKKYHNYHAVLGEIYKNIVNDWREESINLRGYKNPINVRNIANDIPDEAIESLLRVCERNQPLFHRFFEIKRKKLGIKKMTRFDLYAPIQQKKEKKIPYDEAITIVLDVFEKFSSRFKKEALAIIKADHVHSQLQKGKQTGAFCCSVTSKLPPYVLLNYTGTLRDVSTIAHELGHGIHHQLARHHSEYTFHSCLPLAETASIFSEMILSEKVLEQFPDRAKELLFFKLDDLYASIIRQAGFVTFEKKAHRMMEEGRTIEEMSQAYIADLRKQLGQKIEVDGLFAYEWSYIPHIFHTPFYCYAYVFGNLLTLALYEMYKEQGPDFADKIIEMLRKGGSESPLDITKAIGIDICSEVFWQKGFDVIREMIEKIE